MSYDVYDDIKYCVHCGAKLGENQYGIRTLKFIECTRCGTKIEVSGVFINDTDKERKVG